MSDPAINNNVLPYESTEAKLDAVPDHVSFETSNKTHALALLFWKVGIGGGFSLIPPDNATGSFMKIAQRVAVKIDLDSESIKGFEKRLIPGISAIVKVRIRSDRPLL